MDLPFYGLADSNNYNSDIPLFILYHSTGATISANIRFIGAIIGAIGATIGANIEFIYDIIYDTKRFTMTLVESSMTSNIGHLDTNSQSA